jgi:hypothetical protein
VVSAGVFALSKKTSPAGQYLTRFPFNSGDGITRYCVEGVMTDDLDADDIFEVETPQGKVAPSYCNDCLNDLGSAEAIYGHGAQKCMQCGSVFLAHPAE